MHSRTMYPTNNARSEIDERLQRLSQITPARIQLIARSDVGKSSFIVTISSAVRGMRDRSAKVRLNGGSDHTTLHINNYEINNHLSITDMYGWDFNSDNLLLECLRNLLEGRYEYGQLKHDQTVHERDYTRACNSLLMLLTYEDCFVPGMLEKFKLFYETARGMGRVVSFAITKLDLLNSDVGIQNFNNEVDPEKAKHILENSESFKECCKKIQQIIGGDVSCYPLVNYQNHQSSRVRKLDHLAECVVEGILSQIQNENHQNAPTLEEVFDTFQFETPIKALN